MIIIFLKTKGAIFSLHLKFYLNKKFTTIFFTRNETEYRKLMMLQHEITFMPLHYNRTRSEVAFIIFE